MPGATPLMPPGAVPKAKSFKMFSSEVPMPLRLVMASFRRLVELNDVAGRFIVTATFLIAAIQVASHHPCVPALDPYRHKYLAVLSLYL